jgi:hypothetical protein
MNNVISLSKQIFFKPSVVIFDPETAFKSNSSNGAGMKDPVLEI